MQNRMHRPGSILGGVFNEIWVQKLSQIESKFGYRATLVGDVILERVWGDSEGNGPQVTPPRGRFLGGGEGTFLGRRKGQGSNTHAWFTL